MYQSLYRIWRPQTFLEIVGQRHVVQTLKNSISRQKVSHAYLFVGTRGTGKTSIARIFAKALNCLSLNENEPCNKCVNCLSINNCSNMDVFEMDAASNRGIDEIRDIIEQLKFSCLEENKYKVYIIDEAHMLTVEAFNAFLKILEEPPKYVIFILATTEFAKIPVTILSRCQRFDFHKIGKNELLCHLKEVATRTNIYIDDNVLKLIVDYSEGSVRDALGFLEQCAIFNSDNIDEDSARFLLGLANKEILENFIKILLSGNLQKLIAFFISFRNSRYNDHKQLLNNALKELHEEIFKAMKNNKQKDVITISKIIVQGNEILSNCRFISNYDIVIESSLIKFLSENNNIFCESENIKAGSKNVIEKANIENIDKKEYSTIWKLVIDELDKMKKRLICECAKLGVLQYVGDNEIVVEFSVENKFHKERLEREDYHKYIDMVVKKICGNKRVRYILADTKDKMNIEKFFGVNIEYK